MKTNAFLILLLLLIELPLRGVGWLDRKAEGWAWYEDIQKPEAPEEKAQEELKPEIPAPLSAAEKVAKIRKEVEEKLSQAILEPTEENIAVYIREQKKLMDQSGKFSTTWAKVLLQQPDLDATNESPVSQYGIQVYKQLQLERRKVLMQNLNKQYGLFYFYEGNQKTSQAFSLVVQEFAKKHGWEVIGISRDGFLLEGFKDNHPDNGTIKHLGIEVFPSLFLVNPQTKDIRPIAFGLASIDRIETNIELHFSEQVEGQ